MFNSNNREFTFTVDDIGSQLHMLDQRHGNQYKMSNLKNHEFTFTVDDKEIGCGLNGA